LAIAWAPLARPIFSDAPGSAHQSCTSPRRAGVAAGARRVAPCCLSQRRAEPRARSRVAPQKSHLSPRERGLGGDFLL